MKDAKCRDAYRLRKQLLDLIQLEADAVDTYSETIARVTDDELAVALERFRDDHRRHLSELPGAVQHFGWATPEPSVDFKGHVQDLAARAYCVTGTAGAVHAMWELEKVHRKHYAKMMASGLEDGPLADLLRSFSEDERRHLEFMDRRLGHHAQESHAR